MPPSPANAAHQNDSAAGSKPHDRGGRRHPAVLADGVRSPASEWCPARLPPTWPYLVWPLGAPLVSVLADAGTNGRARRLHAAPKAGRYPLCAVCCFIALIRASMSLLF